MTSHTPLYNELNVTKHVCLHATRPCNFCVNKLHTIVEKYPRKNVTYIAPFEVVVHNTPDDLWVSFLGKVYNLTPLIEKYKDDKCIQPLLAFAGKDLSHWFDEKTGEIRHYVHPITGAYVPYCPYGALPQVQAQVPTFGWKEQTQYWWNNPEYMVGYLSRRVRPIRIQNMITSQTCALNVCCEDTLNRILERFLLFNSDADSYSWMYEDRLLDMNKNLEDNGVPDERDKFTSIGLPENTYVPMLLLYYNDDMKWE